MDEMRSFEPDPVPPHLQGGGREFTQILISLTIVLVALTAGTFGWAASDSSNGDEAARVGPRIGEDHWHATYAIYFGEERQPSMPEWESGVHTHGDGIIHIHPFQSFEEGEGASLRKFFDYGGGVLDESQIRVPGFSRTLRDGDPVPGENADGHVFIAASAVVGDERLEDLGNGWSLVSPDYIPHDGDQILFFFSTEDQMRRLVNDITATPRATVVR